MDFLNMIWDMLNGHKFNSGVVMIIIPFILQKYGMDHTAAVQMCTNIMMGIGGVTAAVGFIHRVIKTNELKKQALSQATLTQVQLPGALKVLAVALVAGVLFSANAGPFDYFVSPRPVASYTVPAQLKAAAPETPAPTPATSFWDLKPYAGLSGLAITGSTRPDAEVDVSLCSSAAVGVTYERTILKDGANYSPFSATIGGLLSGHTDNAPWIDLKPFFLLDLLDHKIGAGLSWNAGANPAGVSRLGGVITCGFAIGQN
jgi:hypothetical protein